MPCTTRILARMHGYIPVVHTELVWSDPSAQRRFWHGCTDTYQLSSLSLFGRILLHNAGFGTDARMRKRPIRVSV